ncbi:MAG: CheB methylesterase domain-containing protein [Rickettsiales bacterium]
MPKRPLPTEPLSPKIEYTLQQPKQTVFHVLAIASSTGGPDALLKVFAGLKGKLKHLPIFITQHMPPIFTAALAEHISLHGERPCKEGVDGEAVEHGMTYVAPGGFHMLVRKEGDKMTLKLTQDPPVNSCRPSADPMFDSISKAYGRNVLGLVLTGIGADGAAGIRTIVENGGSVFAQDKETSVVYGMPRSAAETGMLESIQPLEQIPNYLIRRCGG